LAWLDLIAFLNLPLLVWMKLFQPSIASAVYFPVSNVYQTLAAHIYMDQIMS